MDQKSAEMLVIGALGFPGGDVERLGRFLAVSGGGPQDLPSVAGDPEFLAGVLDYLLSDESLLFMFAESEGTDMELPARARQALLGARVHC